jgi:dTDP-4-amino-4,6-dideoxygalactose transaminase
VLKADSAYEATAVTWHASRIPISLPSIGDEEKAAVLAVLNSGMLVQGPQVAALERAFPARLRARRPGPRSARSCRSARWSGAGPGG